MTRSLPLSFLIVPLCVGAWAGCDPANEPSAPYDNNSPTYSSAPAAVVIEGSDSNNIDNPLVQPQDNALAGGGRNQSQNFSDVLQGGAGDDLLIGNLGRDLLVGNEGDDLLFGGTEDFNPENRDFALGGPGNDAFIWAPGDGSDFFDGGPGDADTVIFGIVGEEGDDAPVFAVDNDQQADGIFIDPSTGIPRVDVTGSPGFCNVIDGSSPYVSADDLEALDLTHLVQFSIRSIADAFDADGGEDNGLRVTVHLKNVEFLVCTHRDGQRIEVLDLTTQPPSPASLDDLPERLRTQLIQ